MAQKIIVTDCHTCPFCNSDNEDGFSCNYPNNEVEDEKISGEGIPIRCPLRNGMTLVELEINANQKSSL